MPKMMIEYFASRLTILLILCIPTSIVYAVLIIISGIKTREPMLGDMLEAVIILLLAAGCLMVNKTVKRIIIGLIAVFLFGCMLYAKFALFDYRIEFKAANPYQEFSYPALYIVSMIGIWLAWGASVYYCIRDYCKALDDSTLMGSFLKNPTLFDRRRRWCRMVEQYRSIDTVGISSITIDGKPVDEYYRKKCDLPKNDPFYQKMRERVRTGEMHDEMRVRALSCDDGFGYADNSSSVRRSIRRSAIIGAGVGYMMGRRTQSKSSSGDYNPGAWREPYDRSYYSHHDIDCPHDDPYDCDGDCY